ncbi:MAG: dTDP-4-dehydrorhamnose reductase [Verrucomicrobia bacterium]|nr:dTDP-4-dehydrorhamnose reductase [Verrucomicrobiota bacterium]
MRVAIIGSKGQLGHDCCEVFAGHDLFSADLPELDASDKTAVQNALTDFAPDVVVNCAAYTAVDQCETEQELCWKVNRDVPLYLAEYCGAHSAFLVHVSTDYVFSGDRPLFDSAIETDPTGPVSEYGRSKLAGEQAVVDCFGDAPSYAILRTAWLYGLNGNNFLKTMLRLTRQNPEKTFTVVNDQFGSPTWSHTLARQVKAVVEHRASGVFHATSEGHCSWYELACAFLDELGEAHCFVPCTTEEFPTAAQRPANSILENRHLKDLELNVFEDWKVELVRFANEFVKQEGAKRQ